MSLRIHAAHWFELLVPRPQLPQALDLLARSGQVELEARAQSGWSPIEVDALRLLLEQARLLRQRFAPIWPVPRPGTETGNRHPAEVRLQAAIDALQAWREVAETHVQVIEALGAERRELRRVTEFLSLLGEHDEFNFGDLARPGAHMSSALLVLAPSTTLPRDFAPLLIKQVTAEDTVYALVLGPIAQTAALAAAVGGREARVLHLPPWLEGQAPQALAQVRDRIGTIDADVAEQRRLVDTLSRTHRVAEALGELDQLQWLAGHLAALGASEHLVRVTGWTLAATPDALLAPLLAVGMAAVAGFSAPPPGYRAPTRIDNPGWVRSFELFVRLAGIPGRDEPDPSMLVALIAPLMFGYMFGDIGQGAVLCAAGVWARRRWPAAAMLIPGGLVAIAFGWLFGSVFAVPHIVAPAWIDPIDEPLTVLAVPLGFGAALIVLGQLLNAISHVWSERFSEWLREEAGLLLVYLGAWATLVAPGVGVSGMSAGALWFVLAALHHAGWRNLPARLGALFERLIQLAVNTLSFIRIGAFALAHAGLALAVTALATSFSSWLLRLIIFALGNVLILALEGLVVGVQTTRLLLFEFFIRFVRGEGRPFRPLPPPA